MFVHYSVKLERTEALKLQNEHNFFIPIFASQVPLSPFHVPQMEMDRIFGFGIDVAIITDSFGSLAKSQVEVPSSHIPQMDRTFGFGIDVAITDSFESLVESYTTAQYLSWDRLGLQRALGPYVQGEMDNAFGEVLKLGEGEEEEEGGGAGGAAAGGEEVGYVPASSCSVVPSMRWKVFRTFNPRIG